MTEKDSNSKKSNFKKFSDLNKSAKVQTKEEDKTDVISDEFIEKPNLPNKSQKTRQKK